MHTSSSVVLVLLVSSAPVAYGQTNDSNGSGQPQPSHAHDAASEAAHTGLLGPYPMTREASGTAWQPDSSPMSGMAFGGGTWRYMTHAFLDVVYSDESGPRGDAGGFGTGMLMLMGQRTLPSGAAGFRVMFTAEPAMGSNGYPLLLQTGETADGLVPLIDRQHPHDMLMELAGTWNRGFSGGASFFAYMALAGEPGVMTTAVFRGRRSCEKPYGSARIAILQRGNLTCVSPRP